MGSILGVGGWQAADFQTAFDLMSGGKGKALRIMLCPHEGGTP